METKVELYGVAKRLHSYTNWTNDKPIFKHCTICQWDVGRTMQSLITDVETFN